MARQLYAVDWTDFSSPQVVPVESLPALDPATDGVTFTEAKAEVIEHFTCLLAYAREQIRETRRMRVSDLSGTEKTVAQQDI